MGQEAKRNYHSSAAQKGVRKEVAGCYWLIAILKSRGAQSAPDEGLPSTVLVLLSESSFPSQRGGPTCDTMLCSQHTSYLQRFSDQKAALHLYRLWPLQAESTVVLPIRWSLEKKREGEGDRRREKSLWVSRASLDSSLHSETKATATNLFKPLCGDSGGPALQMCSEPLLLD